MLKFIKKLFLFSSIVLIGGGIWGYYNGMRLDNYQEFIKERIDRFMPEKDLAEKEENPTSSEKPTQPKKTKTKSKETKKIEEGKYELLPSPSNPFSAIDRHSKKAPSSATSEVERLASYLKQKTRTDEEKARAIYIWMTHNVSYDDDSYNSGDYPDYTAGYVLQHRKAVCEGYSNLFLALGKEMGLETKKIVGYSKGYGYVTGSKFKESNHAWNAVKIKGKWRIMDATWGSGYGKRVGGKLKTTTQFNSYWFNVDPYEAIFNHFAEKRENNFVQPTIKLSLYEKMPNLDKAYFQLGFNGKETFTTVNSNPNTQFPTSYSSNTYLALISAPKLKVLNKDQAYYFEFYAPRGYKMACIQSTNKWTYFKREKGKFSLNITPTELGKLQISLQNEKTGKTFETLLIYSVK